MRWPAIVRDSFLKLNPFALLRNPVLLITEIAAAIGTVFQINDLWTSGSARLFDLLMAASLWLTLLAATAAEAFAEEREKERADRFRRSQSDSLARRVAGRHVEIIAPSKLRVGDVVLVEAGELVPVDGEIVEGIATVDESPITGESAPVIRESGSDTSSVTAGTRVLSGNIRVRALRSPGETLIDRMITSLEACNDKRTPDEVRIHSILWIAALLAAVLDASLILFSYFSGQDVEGGGPTLPQFAGLLICLMPMVIAAVVRTCGIAGLGRLADSNVVANAREPLETARQVTEVLMDKTGTVTIGDREAMQFIPTPGVGLEELAEVAYFASVYDSTPEGLSTLRLAQKLVPEFTERGGQVSSQPVQFSEFTRMSGADMGSRIFRKGAVEAVSAFVKERGGTVTSWVAEVAEQLARAGGTPLAVADGPKLLGLIDLRDVVRPGILPRMELLRSMGIRSVLMTGDNPVTGSAIAHEAGMDDVFAQATPADKLSHIRREQERGEVIAMVGDGTDDAPSLAQADVGLAMNCGTVAAKEAGCMVDLANNPADIVSVAAIGRHIWVTRTSLLIFSLFAGIANLLVLVPVLLRDAFPDLSIYALTALQDPNRAVLSGVLFQGVSILLLLYFALRGVPYWPVRLRVLVGRNAVLWGLAGLAVPPLGILIVYRVLAALHIPVA